MNEFVQTIAEELKRLSAEGVGAVDIDDSSVEILRKMASASEPEENPAPARSNAGGAHSAHSSGGAANVSAHSAHSKPAAPEEKFVDDVRPVEFVSELDISASERAAAKPRALKVNVSSDMNTETIPQPSPFKLPDGDKRAKWNFLRELVLNDKVCNAHVKPTKKVVFGVGNLDAKIFFCGEAPGADEEIQGEPFVGKAGQLLTKIIGAMGLSRDDVYIGNIMNWRPEMPTPRGNRPPTEEEMNYCLPYLKAQIQIVNPQVVVALGMTAVNGLLGFDPTRRMGKIRGTWQDFEGRELMITYHPSFLLQYASNAMKRLVWEDMMAVMKKVCMEVSEKQENFFK